MRPSSITGHSGLTLRRFGCRSRHLGFAAPRDFDAWFGRNVEALVSLVVAAQERAISSADGYVADALDEIGTSVAAEVQTAPAGLVGVASDGRELSSLLLRACDHHEGRIAQGAGAAQAWESGLAALVTRVQTQVADTARVAAGLSITARPRVGLCGCSWGGHVPDARCLQAASTRTAQASCGIRNATAGTSPRVRTPPTTFGPIRGSSSPAERSRAGQGVHEGWGAGDPRRS